MSKERKGIWSLIPSKDPADQLYNRRLLSYFGLAYSAIWFQQVLIIIVVGMVLEQAVTAAVVTALLGVPAGLAGLGFFNYLNACKVDDRKRSEENADRQTESEPPESISPPQE